MKFYRFPLLLILGLGCPAWAQELNLRRIEETARAELRATKTPGAAIAVIQNGRIVLQTGIGVANAESEVLVTEGTLFPVGSVTKPLTAAALLTLSDQGKLRLDIPIAKTLSGLSLRLSRVTLHQLLSQTSGLRDEPSREGAIDQTPLANYVRGLGDEALLIEPGKAFSYSNLGFAVAGAVLEQASGKPYAAAMEEILFKPLGMSRSTFEPAMAMTYPLAVGHKIVEGRPLVVRPFSDQRPLWPAGFLYSSISDLARFAVAFLNEGVVGGRQVLRSEVIGKMSQPQAAIPTGVFENGQYGYGMFIHTFGSHRMLEHGGTMSGTGCELQMILEARAAVIACVNNDGVRLRKTLAAAWDLLLGSHAPQRADAQPVSLPISLAEMKRYAGRYSNRWEMELRVEEGALVLRQFGATFPVRKVADSRFSISPQPGAPPQEFLIVTGADGQPEFIQFALWVFKRRNP